MDYYAVALERATEVLGTRDKAEEWLGKMSATLGCSPKDLLNDQDGLNKVLSHIRGVEFALDTD